VTVRDTGARRLASKPALVDHPPSGDCHQNGPLYRVSRLIVALRDERLHQVPQVCQNPTNSRPAFDSLHDPWPTSSGKSEDGRARANLQELSGEVMMDHHRSEALKSSDGVTPPGPAHAYRDLMDIRTTLSRRGRSLRTPK
jgi:hypothetical protein